MPKTGIACNLDINILQAALPLLETGKIECLEWSFDAIHTLDQIPDWFTELLHAFSKEDSLIGHGVFFSIFSGNWKPEQQNWLAQLSVLCNQYRFSHISEHFGYMTGADFHTGAPIPFPLNHNTYLLGKDRLNRIADVCQCPVGLENLALVFSEDDVKRQGEFLEKLLSAVSGFLILDLHNLYCQAENFKLDHEKIMGWYPLELVREIHVSGGSWESSATNPGRKIRRDTHDGTVPQPVLNYIKSIWPKLPNLKYAILEQLPLALASEIEKENFRADYEKLCHEMAWVHNQKMDLKTSRDFLQETMPDLSGLPLEFPELFNDQRFVSTLLENEPDIETLLHKLKNKLGNTDWQVESWDLSMLETASLIARKWKSGLPGVLKAAPTKS